MTLNGPPTPEQLHEAEECAERIRGAINGIHGECALVALFNVIAEVSIICDTYIEGSNLYNDAGSHIRAIMDERRAQRSLRH